MLNFSLGRIPVTVQASHLIVAALIGFMFVPAAAPLGVFFSDQVVASPGDPDFERWRWMAIGGWMVIIFVSVLAHELGHALASMGYGFAPKITLAWLGGHTETGMAMDTPWFRRVAITLAGPFAGLLAGVVAGVFAWFLDAPPFVEYLLWGALGANIFWAILNLLPVTPLDGSHVAQAVLMRVLGRKGFVVAHGIGLVLGGLLAIFFIRSGSIIAAFIFGMGAVDAWRMISAYRRGEVVGTPEATHALGALDRAQDAIKAGDLDTAHREASSALMPQAPKALHSHAHQLLGWIALRRGDGRRALEHFSQVTHTKLEREPMATAYSLAGDDAQAATLWELAYRERKTDQAAEAWAGSLVLAGDDTRVAGISPADAQLAASRIAFRRKQFELSAQLAERSLETSPSDQAAYDAACAYAQLGETERAFALLDRARQLGFSDVDHAAKDPDLGPLRAHPGFSSWLQGADSRSP